MAMGPLNGRPMMAIPVPEGRSPVSGARPLALIGSAPPLRAVTRKRCRLAPIFDAKIHQG